VHEVGEFLEGYEVRLGVFLEDGLCFGLVEVH
jgi:hypothetical protein